ncbi:hypothetical protein CPB85DRAFT_1429243 [Mucidula mucida]|nr:hypothetical protein CPB85DRAFT_1429243 [Mucidula mucida]
MASTSRRGMPMSDLRSDREDTPSTDGEPSSSRYTSKLGRHCHLPPSPARGRNSATYPTSQPIFTGMKGVWTRGPYYVLSQDFPLVVKAIDYANRHWTLPAELEDLTLYVLAALEVSEHPSWPSHWLFWGDATREATKARCKQALGAKPCTVYFKGPIIDDHTLSLYHTLSWHNVIKDKPWYSQLAAKAPPGPATRKRNREVVDISNSPDGSENGFADDSLPPAKRTRMTRRKAAEAAISPSVNAEQPTTQAASSSTPPPARRAGRPRRVTPKAQTPIPSASNTASSEADTLSIPSSSHRSNSQTSGTVIGSGSDRAQSESTTVEPSPSPRGGVKDLPVDVCGPRRSGRNHATPPTEVSKPSYRTVRPRSTPTPAPQKMVEDAPTPSITESEATNVAKVPAKAKRAKTARK